MEPRRIQDHVVLFLLAAGGNHLRDTGDGEKSPAYDGLGCCPKLERRMPIGLEYLAAAAHVSAEHLVRLFRRDLGLTPSRYLWQLRLRAGIHLLGHSTLPVAEIAHRSGFQTPSHFSRAIREATRLRPGELRRRSLASAASPGDTLLISR